MKKNDLKTGLLNKAGAVFVLLLVATITISCSRFENDDDISDHSEGERSGKLYGGVSWKYNKFTKTLTFSGKGIITNQGDNYKPLGFEKVVIENGITSIGTSAFQQCLSLTSITISNSVTSIGDGAFYYCRGLTSVTIPNSVTSIENNAFCDTGLTSIDIPNSVTSIGEAAFYDCYDLTSITIPNSVTSIGDKAFYNCTGLTDVYSLIKEPFAITDPTFQFKNIPTDPRFYYSTTYATLHVPKGTKAKYEATMGWKIFRNIVEM